MSVHVLRPEDWMEQTLALDGVEPFAPEHPDELIGIEIIFERGNRGQENGFYWTDNCGWVKFEHCFRGEVIDWTYYEGRNMPQGLYMTVQCDAFNTPIQVFQSKFICYGFEVEATAEAIAS